MDVTDRDTVTAMAVMIAAIAVVTTVVTIDTVISAPIDRISRPFGDTGIFDVITSGNCCAGINDFDTVIAYDTDVVTEYY